MKFRPKTYVEIGSGNTTKFARHCIDRYGLNTQIVSIDPEPRAEIDGLCDTIIRQPLEQAQLDVFDQLGDGDILVVDNSHRCFQNSDVTVVFLEVLPRLKAGVLIYIDDIYLPSDYPQSWTKRYFSEQYLLAVLLLNDKARRYEVVFPGYYIHSQDQFAEPIAGLWEKLGQPGMEKVVSNGFWLRVSD